MNPPGGLDGRGLSVRLWAAVAVLLLHGVFYLALVHGEPRGQADGLLDVSMRVEFIPSAPRQRPASPPPAVVRLRSGDVSPVRRRREMEARVAAPAPGPTSRDSAAAGSAAGEPLRLGLAQGNGLDQELGWEAPGRPSAEADPVPERFRMRRPVRGKDVIEGTAQAIGLWPPGYTTDPCPRIKRNIGALMTDTRDRGREALKEELRRQSASCP